MRPTSTLLLYSALVAASSQTASVIQAQGLAYATSTTKSLPAVEYVLHDKVGADLSSRPRRKENQVYHRSIELLPEGMYAVRITDAFGRTRMVGSYLDSELKVPHGRFTYYHPQGGFESTGEYRMGRKVGTWTCADVYGVPRADRHYQGLDWAQWEVALRLATMAH